MTDIKLLEKTIEDNLDNSLQELAKLCAQPSVAAQGIGMQESAEMVAAMLTERGFDVQIMPTDGFPVVYAERAGRSEKTLLFYNHYDVQPAEPLELWDSPPFEPTFRDGKMYARGVSDDKGHFITRLAAVDSYLENEGELPCRVKFIVEGEEEIGSVHLGDFIKEHKELLAADGCLWEFGSIDEEGVPIQYAGLRGICYVELSVESASQDAHSGLGGSIFPNAAWRLVWALSTLKGEDEHIRLPGFYDKVIPASDYDMQLMADMPDESELLLRTYGLDGFLLGTEAGAELRRQAVFEPTCTICGLTSGYQGTGSKTVLPAQASAKVDFRIVPLQTPQDLLKQLRQHLDSHGFEDVQVNFLGGNPAGRTDPQDPFLQLVVESAEAVYGMPMRIHPMCGGSGPNYHFLETLKVPVATAGMGYAGTNVHAPNENIIIELFLKGIKHTLHIMDRFAEMK